MSRLSAPRAGPDIWQVLRMHYMGGKCLNGIKGMYVNSLVSVRVKGEESECL